MPTVRRSRTLAAAPEQVWQVVGDPHHLPRWWPRVDRVEAVDHDAFTEVLTSSRGRPVRADFTLVEAEPGRRVVWAQQLDGTPFARVLREAVTRIELVPSSAPAARSCEVCIELRQRPRGFFATLGSGFVRRAAVATLDDALDGLERIIG